MTTETQSPDISALIDAAEAAYNESRGIGPRWTEGVRADQLAGEWMVLTAIYGPRENQFGNREYTLTLITRDRTQYVIPCHFTGVVKFCDLAPVRQAVAAGARPCIRWDKVPSERSPSGSYWNVGVVWPRTEAERTATMRGG
jgi:hypothetical protein